MALVLKSLVYNYNPRYVFLFLIKNRFFICFQKRLLKNDLLFGLLRFDDARSK